MSETLDATAAAAATAAPEPRRAWNRALVALFAAFVLVGNLDLAFGLDPNPNPLRRSVAFPRPKLDRSLVGWPGKLKWYVESNMGFRPSLVRARGLFAWHVLGVSPAPNDVIRADPWLFQRNESVLDDYRRTTPLSPAELDRWVTTLEARRVWLERQGIYYMVVIAPSKETVYADAMPSWATRWPGPSRLEQLRQAVLSRSHVELVDLTEPLEAESARGTRLYHLTDTHWDDAGALVGYRVIAGRLASWFPGLRVASAADFEASLHLVPGGDLARECGVKADLAEPQTWLTPRAPRPVAILAHGAPYTVARMDINAPDRVDTASPTGEIASAVILRDSFGEGLIPYLAPHLREGVWLTKYDFPEQTLLALQPKLVIEQLVERKLQILEPGPPPSSTPPSIYP